MSEHEGIWREYRPTYADHWSGYKRIGDLVRCRDCELFAPDHSDHDYRSGWWCHRWNTDMVGPNGFCAWGRRAAT